MNIRYLALRSLLVVTLFISSTFAQEHSASWPQFRGPTGDGHSTIKNVPTKWSNGSNNIAWETDLPGIGWSSPVVIDNEVWMTTAVEDDTSLRAVCVELSSGMLIKNVLVFDKEKFGKIHKKNSHASPTALIDGELIFLHFGDYGTACITRKGEVKWKRELVCGHFHGPGGSPALFQDRVFINRDGSKQQYVIALNKLTGETIWKTERKHCHPDRFTSKKMVPIAYTTPTVLELDGRDVVLSCGADHIAAYDCDSGEELWWAAYDGYSVVPRPTVGNGMVFYSSSYDRPIFYGLKLDGAKGDISKTHLAWKIERKAPHNPSPLVAGDEVYFVSDDGVGHCVDAESGNIHWRERLPGSYSASPFLIGEHIYFQNETGVTSIIAASKEFKVVAENRIEGRTLATPTPVDGALLIRAKERLLRINAP